MSLYQLACDKRITISAVVLEILMVLACILLGDAVAQQVLEIPTMLDNHVSVRMAVVIVLVLQYLLVGIEMVARFREDRRGFTLPLVFLPGGIVLRTAFMAVLTVVVVALKLLVYFVSVLFAFIFQIFRVDRLFNTAFLVDGADRVLEPLELGVNHVYNALYFHKIRANTSVFTAIFNGSLSFWCINH